MIDGVVAGEISLVALRHNTIIVTGIHTFLSKIELSGVSLGGVLPPIFYKDMFAHSELIGKTPHHA
jgi:hypothetical protein